MSFSCISKVYVFCGAVAFKNVVIQLYIAKILSIHIFIIAGSKSWQLHMQVCSLYMYCTLKYLEFCVAQMHSPNSFRIFF